MCNRGCIIIRVRTGGDEVRPGRTGLSRDARLLVAGQGVRAAGYGFTAVLSGRCSRHAGTAACRSPWC